MYMSWPCYVRWTWQQLWRNWQSVTVFIDTKDSKEAQKQQISTIEAWDWVTCWNPPYFKWQSSVCFLSQEKWDWDSWSWDQWDNNKSRSWKGTVHSEPLWCGHGSKPISFYIWGDDDPPIPVKITSLELKICNFMNFPYLGVNNHESQLFGGVHLGIP